MVGQSHIGADKDVVGDSLAEDFNTEDIGDDFFSFTLEVGMDESDVVVGNNNVSECG